jgi:FlaA1/EpsC-like NDP-sugar epimerase
VTHEEVTRYFMSIHEAVALVIQAGSLGEAGEIFLLDMGGPVKIMDLAHNMIKLAGHSIRDDSNPDGDIEIQVTGLRPGEKLYEELLITDANACGTVHPKIMMASEPTMPCDRLNVLLARLEAMIADRNAAATRDLLLEIALSPVVDGFVMHAAATPSPWVGGTTTLT